MIIDTLRSELFHYHIVLHEYLGIAECSNQVKIALNPRYCERKHILAERPAVL